MREAVKRRKRHKAGPLFGDRRVGEQWCNIFARCEGAAAFLYDTTTDTLLFEDGSGRMRRIRRFLKEGYRSFPAVPRDRELFARTVRSMKERKISQRQCRLRIPERGGSLCWYDCRIAVLSGSIGIAIAPDDGKTYGELYAAADRAMYEVKKNSKQGYAFFSDPS